ncbi:MAG: glycosyltransferase [Flavobacteriaceae bacterium]|nr:glycosyltransferase [Flavobacteriaceae bacterium]
MIRKKIIVAPLNWGLGHATRCIPIINLLLQNNFTPVIASDGNALDLLKKEFPDLEILELPTYNIRYGRHVRWNLFLRVPKILRAVRRETRVINEYIAMNEGVVGIISDNRFGVYSERIPSVYVTHQLNVLSGWTTWLTTKIHRSCIQKFNECWIPDQQDSSFSGKLSLSQKIGIPLRYIGILSRFKPEKLPIKNTVLLLLSGPEPNRTHLEEKLLKQFTNYRGNIVMVRGIMQDKQTSSRIGNITTYNYLLSPDLERKINQSELVICRSGYSSVMDLAALGKKAFFIPTHGQNEQELLAKHLETQKIAPYSNERAFEIDMLKKVKTYKGFHSVNMQLDKDLLHLFEGK